MEVSESSVSGGEGIEGMGEVSEGREQGRGCYPDGCRQRSDGSAALRAVPEPRGIPTRYPAESSGRRREGSSVDEDAGDWRRPRDATPLPPVPPIREGVSRPFRRCPPTAGRSDARDPSEISSVVLRYRASRWPFFALSACERASVFAPRLYATAPRLSAVYSGGEFGSELL